MSQISLISSDAAKSIPLTDTIQVSASGIVSRTLVQSPELRATLFAFDSGQELTTHTNRRRAFVQILTGECEFQFDGQWQRLSAGAFVHLPPNHPHAVRATEGPFSMLLTLGADPAV
jgi:quercetin dioxygenase-like cupin family protein